MTDKTMILTKIKKLFALAQSPNENEAAAAMNKAQELMQEHDITMQAIEALAVECAETESVLKTNKLPKYTQRLLSIIMDAFGVKVIACGRRITIFGHNSRAEIAQYAYEAMDRQLLNARKDFLRDNRGAGTRNADIFCHGWVLGAAKAVKAYPLSDKEKVELDEAKNAKFTNVRIVQSRNSTRRVSAQTYGYYMAGLDQGEDARLYAGVNDASNNPQELTA